MAVFALTAEQLTINAVDYTALSVVKGAVLTVNGDSLDPTVMGDGWKRVLGGLKGGQLAVNLVDDMAASTTDALLWPLFNTVVTFEIRSTTAVVGPTNPKYTGSVHIATLSIGGQVGELAMKSGLTWPTSGIVSRATS